jgi:hypothetical protein
MPGNPPKFEVLSPWGFTWGDLACDPTWREGQPEKLEFIVIAVSRLEPWDKWSTGSEDSVVVDIMCIKRDGGKAERMALCSSKRSIKVEAWMELNPEEKFIRLG